MKFNRAQLDSLFTRWYGRKIGVLRPSARQGLSRLVDFIEVDPAWKSLQHASYFVASVMHETGATFQPITERRAVKGRSAEQDRIYGLQNRYWPSGFYGRGFIQLTHRDNYEKFGKLLKIDLVGNPDLALDPENSYWIAACGMRLGLFTGKKLSDFDTVRGFDYEHAQQIVNGMDRAVEIARLATVIEPILRASLIGEKGRA